MDEKFSVSLELITQKYKEGINKVREVAKAASQKIKENMTVELPNNPFKNMSAESELLLNKINDIKATLQMASENNKLLPKQDILEMRVELEKLEEQFNSINGKGNAFSNMFNKVQKGMDSSIGKVKRFTLALFGVQSVFRALSKASSAYLSQDEETSSKIQSAWIGLGSMFAPLLEKIANFTIKAVSYINIFVKALTGVDFLSRAISKSMDKANKNAGKLSKTLAGFDELTNLDDSKSGASIDTSWIDNFKNVELDPKVSEWFENLGRTVKGIWDKYLGPFFKWMKENWDGAGKDVVGFGLLVGVAIDLATGNWIGAIIKFIGFVLLYWGDLVESIKTLWNGLVWWFKNMFIPFFVGVFSIMIDLIMSPFTILFDFIKGGIESVGTFLNDMYKGFKKILEGIIDLITGIFTGNWKKAWEGVQKIFSGIFDTLWGIVKFPLNLIIDGLNALIKGVNKVVVNGLNKMLSIGKVIGIDIQIPTIPTIPKLEVGTPNVEKSGIAWIDQGEAVVPKKFNSDEYFSRLGTNNSEETNSLLRDLIDRVERIEITPYTTIRDVGQASQTYRNQQSRLMGEELA